MRNEIGGAFDQRLPMRRLGIFPHKDSLKTARVQLARFRCVDLAIHIEWTGLVRRSRSEGVCGWKPGRR